MSEEEQIILPERFKRLSSIITNGTQWIDTGYVPTNTTGFWVDSIDIGNANNYVMGMNETTDWNSNNRMYIRTSTNLGYGWMTYTAVQNINSYNKRIIASLNFLNSRKASLTLEGVNYESEVLPDLSFTPSKSLYISAINYGGSPSTYISKLQIFEAKISEGTEVVRYFVPAYDTETQKACMYEVLNDTPYYDANSGDFDYYLMEESEEEIVLPERFKRVEYISDTGTQWIDTGYIPDSETGMYIHAKQDTSTDGFPFGCGLDATGISAPRMLLSGNTGIFYNAWIHFLTIGSGSKGNEFVGHTNWLNCKKSAVKRLDDGRILTYNLRESLSFTPTAPLFLFRCNTGSANRVWKGRIYDAKISQGNEIVRHFIPIYDTQRSTYCMYETIEGKVYYNQGSGAFGTSPKEEVLYGITNKLPEGFKRVEYLLSPGLGAYIDTGYVPTNETGYYVEAQAFKNETSYVFGSNETTNWNDNKRIYFMLGNSTTWGWMTYGTLTSAGANLRHPTLCDFNFLNSRKVVTTINNTDFTYELSDLNFAPTRSIYLFTVNKADTPHTEWHDGTISRFKISEGTEIVRDFIPCLDPDGWPCMYELMEGKAYYNQGTSSFGYPRDYKENTPYELPAGYKKCVYLQSNGTQWINTDHIPDGETGLYLKAQHLNYGDFNNFGTWENSSVYFYPPRFNTSNKSGTWAFGTTYQMLFYYDKGDDLIYTSTMNLYNDRTVNMWSEDTDYHGYITFAPKAMTRPLWLFSYNMDNATINTTYGAFGGRIFRAKITQGTSLIHDYVPCLDDSGRPCMYDLIDHVPLYNQSGGAEFAYCLEHQLPSDFVKLKYLESTGTQIIKTGIIPTDSTGIYVEAYHTKYNGDTDWSVIGLRNTNGNTYFTVGRVQRDTNGAGFGWGAITSPGGTGNVRYEASLNFLNDRQSIITAPSFAQRINALGTLSFTPTKDLYMFGMNNYDGAATLYSTYRIYRAKISEGSEIVRDWVPAYDTRRDKPCMYDLINNIAYYNDGTDEFLYNRDVEGTYTECGIMEGIGNRLGSFEESKLKLSFGERVVINFEGSTASKIKIKFSIDEISYQSGNWHNIVGSTNRDGLNSGIGISSNENYFDVRSSMGGLTQGAWNDTLRTYEIKSNLKKHSLECYVFRSIPTLLNGKNLIYNGEIIEPIAETIMGEEGEGGFYLGDMDGSAMFGSRNGLSLTIYSSQAWDRYDVLLWDIEPMIKNDIKGLYNKVNKTFYPVSTTI